MPDSDRPRRPAVPPPPRFARGWCPRCRHWLEAQWTKGRPPDRLICHGCHVRVDAASWAHYPLAGSHQATAVWGDPP